MRLRALGVVGTVVAVVATYAVPAAATPAPTTPTATPTSSTASSTVTATPVAPPTTPSPTSRALSTRTQLRLKVSGVPKNMRGKILLSGPKFKATATGSKTFTKIRPGKYKVNPQTVNVTGGRLVPTYSSKTFLVKNNKATTAPVVYRYIVTPKPPTAVRNLTSIPRHQEVVLNWQAPASPGTAPITGYQIQNDPDLTRQGRAWTPIATVGPNVTTYTVPGLQDGLSYQFRVIALNRVGSSTPAAAQTTPTETVPDPPTTVAGTRGNTQVDLTWTPANYTGGQPVTSYSVQYQIGNGSWQTGGTTPDATAAFTVTGLTNGTAYRFRVAATNSIGTSDFSAPSSAVTPATTPGAPTGLAGTVGNQQIALTWSAPASTGGDSITDYVVQYKPSSSLDWSTFNDGVGTTRSATVTGLTNYTAYDFQVAAVNTVGQGSFGTPISKTPIGVPPGAPTGVTPSSRVSSAYVSWTAPASDGNSTITKYWIRYTTDNGTNWSTPVEVPASPLNATVTGLTNGLSYKFAVRAENVEGTSPWSATSSAAIPADVPGAPTGVGGTPGNKQVALSWTAPGNNGGNAITGYKIQYLVASDTPDWNSATSQDVGATTTATVTGLANDTAYLFRVAAINEPGQGAFSAQSSAITPVGVIPGAPTGVGGTFGNTQVALSWTAPAYDGDTPLTGYAVRYSSNGGTSWSDYTTTNSTTTDYTVTGLTNGTEYLFEVAAINNRGRGPASDPSSAISPATNPSAPSAPTVTSGNEELGVSWSAPNNGGRALTGYTLEYATDAATPNWDEFGDIAINDGSATSYTLTGLTNYTSYVVRISATNVVGTSSPSTPSTAVAPEAVPPNAPTAVEALAGVQSASVSWTAPGWDGNADITNYEVQAFENQGSVEVPAWNPVTPTQLVGSNATTYTFTDLTNGTQYAFKVRGVNQAGNGDWSSLSANSVIPADLPDAPTDVAADTSGVSQEVEVTWSAPANDGGNAIKNYIVQYSLNSGPPSWQTYSHPVSNATSILIPGLTNDVEYIFRVAAVNDPGQGDFSDPSAPAYPRGVVPGAPSGVSAAASNAQAEVSWDAPSDNGGTPLTDYQVRYSSNGGTSWSDGVAVGANFADRVYTVTGLTNGLDYLFEVAAVNNRGVGAWSAPSDPVTPATIPGAPTGVAGASTGTSQQVQITWTAPADNGGNSVKDYVVQYALDDEEPSWQTFTHDASTTASATISGLTNDVPYLFRVAAVNDAGQGDFSANSAPITPLGVAPGAPTNVAGTFGNQQVTVTWNAPSDDGGTPLTDYQIRYSSDSGSNWSEAVAVGATFADRSFAVTGLTNGLTYIFEVAAVNNRGAGAWSSASSGVVPATVPDAPTDVSGVRGVESVALSWTAPATTGGDAVTNYLIDATTDAGENWTQVASVGSNSTSKNITGLTNGVGYQFRVKAVNKAGTGSPSSTSATVTPATAPQPPTSVSGTRGDQQVSLTWTAPVNNGGAAITNYLVHYSTNGGSTWADPISTGSSTASYTVTGLTNGTSYVFEVAAVNTADPSTSAYSDPSAGVRPAALPGAPTDVAGVSGNASVALSWAAPSADGGETITDYAIYFSSNSGTDWTPVTKSASTSTTYTVTGLTNGTSYIFRVASVNVVGESTPSASSSAIVPATAPGQPTNVVGTTQNQAVDLSWTAPASDGGSAITGYRIQYTQNPDSFSGATTVNTGSTGVSYQITGLTNGVEYYFRVLALNGSTAGIGAYSTKSDAVTPATTPGVPTNLEASTGYQSAQLTWTAPADNGGLPIVTYYVQYRLSTTEEWTTFDHADNATSEILVTGLTNDLEYYFRVASHTNAASGTSAYTSETGPIIPQSVPPNAPTGLSAVRGNTEASLTWTAPTNLGGSSIIDYQIAYSSNSGGQWHTYTRDVSTATSATVSGLNNGTPYIFRVRGRNGSAIQSGYGSWSAPSSPVTPATTPGSPTDLSGERGDERVRLTWTAPASNGGAAIVDYKIEYSTDGTEWTTFTEVGQSTSTTADVTGLTNGTSYIFRVSAINTASQPVSAPSADSDAYIPATAPDAPTDVVGTRGNELVALSWTVPASDNGSAISDYLIQYTDDDGETWTDYSRAASTATSANVYDLYNGTAYKFRVFAINAADPYISEPSETSSAVTPATIPGVPTSLTATKGNGRVDLSWTAPASNGGSAITTYQVQYAANNSNTWSTYTHVASAATTITVDGLTNFTAYRFRVAATNDVGTGPNSGETSNVTPNPYVAPDAPTALTVGSEPLDRKADLSWTAPAYNGGANVTNYLVQYSANDGTSWSTFSHSASSATTITVTGLTNDTPYVFRVAAINSEGTSGYSNVSSPAYTPRNPAATPPAPSQPSGVASNQQVALSWSAPSMGDRPAIQYYKIYAATGDSEDFNLIVANTGSTSTSYTVTGLTNETVYRFKVAGFNTAGIGTQSAESYRYVPMPNATCSDRGPNAYLANCNLTNATITNSDLTGANLTGARITNTRFDQTSLRGANLAYTIGSSTYFDRGDLSGTDLRYTRLSSPRFNQTTFNSSTNFTRAYLNSAEYTNANLTGLTFGYADLTSARFTNSDLHNVDFRTATLNSAVLDATITDGANFSGVAMRSSSMSNAQVGTADFTNADLTSSSAQGSFFNDATFAGTNLTNATFDYSHLDGVDLTTANLYAFKLRYGTMLGANVAAATANSAKFNYSDVSGTNFEGANLQSSEFANTDARDVNLHAAEMAGSNIGSSDFAGADLSDAELNSVTMFAANFDADSNLAGINFTGAYLPASSFRDVDLTGANFNGANAESNDFTNADLSGANFTSASAYNSTFAGATITSGPTGTLFTGTNLAIVDLSNRTLDNVNFYSATLEGSNLSNSSFTSADLRGANLIRTDLTDASFTTALLNNAALQHARIGASFTGATLTNADLRGAELDADASFYGATLSGTYLEDLTLDGVDFTSANLNSVRASRADFSGATLLGSTMSGANMTGTVWSNTTVIASLSSNANFNGANLSASRLDGVDFSGLSMRGVSFSSASARGANFSGTDLIGSSMDSVDFVNAVFDANTVLRGSVGSSTNGINMYRSNYSGATMAGVNFTGVNMWGSQAAGANLAGANFTNANLTRTRFDGATFTGANLASVTATQASMVGANFNTATITNGNWSNTNFTNATMQSVAGTSWYLRQANLTGVNLTGATLTSAGLRETTMTAATTLTGATLTNADLTSAMLDGVAFNDVTANGSTFTEASAVGTNFTGANLASSTWTNTDMRSAILSTIAQGTTNFTNASFVGADLTDQNLQLPTLTNANFTNATMVNVTMTDKSVSGINLTNADLSGAALAGTTFTSATFTQAVLRGATMTNAVASSSTFNAVDANNASMAGINLSNANATNSSFSGANMTGAVLNSTNLTGSRMLTTNLTNASMASTNLASANLRTATLTGVTSSSLTGTPMALPAGWSIVSGQLVHA